MLWRDTAVALSAVLDPTAPLALAPRPAAVAELAFAVHRPEGVILDVVMHVA